MKLQYLAVVGVYVKASKAPTKSMMSTFDDTWDIDVSNMGVRLKKEGFEELWVPPQSCLYGYVNSKKD